MNGKEDDLVVSISNDYIEIYYLKLRDSSRDRLTKVWIMEYVQESQIVLLKIINCFIKTESESLLVDFQSIFKWMFKAYRRKYKHVITYLRKILFFVNISALTIVEQIQC